METKPKVKIPQGTKVLFRERVNGLEKQRYEESVKHAVERMRFAADAVKRAKLPMKYRAIAFAGLMSHVPYMSLTPFLR